MTKKHFIAIAAILKKFHATDTEIEAFADLFQTQNPAFDRARFIAACHN